jgi:hypothetical protein
MTPNYRQVITGIASAAGLAAACSAQTLVLDFPSPTQDRWMYFQGQNPGLETRAPIWGTILEAGFDDRDAQFLLGWDTASQVTTGLPLDEYTIVSARVRVYAAVGDQFRYNPDAISYRNVLPTTDPEYVAPATAGFPIELHGVGWRGASPATWTETSPFAGAPPLVPPAERVRANVAATFDTSGATATDISRQVRLRFDAAPWGIGRTSTVTPGALVPQGTEFVLDVDLCGAGARGYLQRALRDGRLFYMISTLSPAVRPGPGTPPPSYPVLYTRQDAVAAVLGQVPRLELTVRLGNPADQNGDGERTFDDIQLFVQRYNANDLSVDFNADCELTFDDVQLFVQAYNR